MFYERDKRTVKKMVQMVSTSVSPLHDQEADNAQSQLVVAKTCLLLSPPHCSRGTVSRVGGKLWDLEVDGWDSITIYP